MRRRKVRLHFNRNAVLRGLRTIWTVHTSTECIPASEVVVSVPLTTVFKGHDAPQPGAYLSGYAHVQKVGSRVYLQ